MEGARHGISTVLHDIIAQFGLPSVLSFRLIMESTGCVVSGSYALLALHPGAFKPEDLDLYVPSDGFDTLVGYLQQNGYTLDASPTDYQYLSPSILNVRRLVRRDTHTAIDVVSIQGHDPLKAVVEFHSTLLMNAITSSGAICLYASLTLRRLGIINYGLSTTAPGGIIVFDKYCLRGFTLEESMHRLDDYTIPSGHRCRVDPSCPSTVRTVYDSGSLFIALDGFDEHLPSHRPTLVWKLANDSCCPGETDGFTIRPNCVVCESY